MSDQPNATEASDDTAAEGPTDETVVQTAATAAERVVFDRYDQSAVKDLDVTVTFEAGVLDVDVYVNAPDDPEAVATAAAEAAGEAVDELFRD